MIIKAATSVSTSPQSEMHKNVGTHPGVSNPNQTGTTKNDPPAIELKKSKRCFVTHISLLLSKGNNYNFAKLAKKYGLNADQRHEIHRLVGGQGYGYHEIEELILDYYFR